MSRLPVDRQRQKNPLLTEIPPKIPLRPLLDLLVSMGLPQEMAALPVVLVAVVSVVAAVAEGLPMALAVAASAAAAVTADLPKIPPEAVALAGLPPKILQPRRT